MATKQPQTKKHASSQSVISKLKANPVALIYIVVFTVAGAVFLFQTHTAPPPKGNGIKVYLNPSSAAMSLNTNYTVEVRENSLTTTVNAVNAEITYDATKFTVAGIDGTGSPFELKAVEDSVGGVIRIARATTTPVSGDQLVTKVTLIPIATVRKTSLTFRTATALASASTSTNVLQATADGSYSIK